MEKRAVKGRRKASQTRGVIVGQVQSGLLLGFGIVTLFIVFGAGVLVGMWYQASEYTTSYADATSATGRDASTDHAAATDAPKMTFYSTLQTHDPAPPTLTAPSPPAKVPPAEPAYVTALLLVIVLSRMVGCAVPRTVKAV